VSKLKIQLLYPPATLNPNGRNHWAAVARVRCLYRATCRVMTAGEKNRLGYKSASRPHVIITFHPPDKRKRDMDNMIAAFKAGQDGVADAIGVDDSKWVSSYRIGQPVKGGLVIVEIGGNQDEVD